MDHGVVGIGALGFWLFIALIVIGGMWYSIREKEIKQETIRRLIESGRDVDPAVMDKLIGQDKRLDRELMVAGLIVLFVAPGLALLGWFISLLSAPWLLPMLGVAVLVAFVGIGLIVAAKIAARSYGASDEQQTSG